MSRSKELRAWLLDKPKITGVRISRRGEVFTRRGGQWGFEGMSENLLDRMDEDKFIIKGRQVEYAYWNDGKYEFI